MDPVPTDPGGNCRPGAAAGVAGVTQAILICGRGHDPHCVCICWSLCTPEPPNSEEMCGLRALRGDRGQRGHRLCHGWLTGVVCAQASGGGSCYCPGETGTPPVILGCQHRLQGGVLFGPNPSGKGDCCRLEHNPWSGFAVAAEFGESSVHVKPALQLTFRLGLQVLGEICLRGYLDAARFLEENGAYGQGTDEPV